MEEKTTKGFLRKLLFIVLPIVITLSAMGWYVFNQSTNPYSNITPESILKIKDYAQRHKLSLDDYPDSLLYLLNKNPECEDFVMCYPIEKDIEHEIDLSELKYSSSVPLLMQWDKRWGYRIYGANVLGLTGCGPTSLSMVAIHLTGNTEFSPKYVADFSIRNGYCIYGNGSSWELMNEGARKLGLKVRDLPIDKQAVFRALERKEPVIAIMGKGDFSESGHFIVFTGLEDGLIKINDCNSYKNSEKLWNYDEIEDQIRNVWSYTY